MINILSLTLYGPLAASTRYRLLQYIPGLNTQDIQLQVNSLLNDAYLTRRFNGQGVPWANILQSGVKRLGLFTRQRHYHCAFVYSELFPLLPGLFESRLLRIPYIYDFDDAFYLKYQSKRFRAVSPLLKNKFDAVIRRAAVVTAGNQTLADYASALNPNVIVLPTVVDTERYSVSPQKAADVFTVGWIGSPSTAEYLNQVVEALSLLGKESPLQFIVIGGRAPAIPNVQVIEVPWREDTEIFHINRFDVGIMPLPDTAWARGKCAFKLIQYMACGVPVVASPVGANRDVVHENCGFFADDTEQWLHALRTLRDNPEQRDTMGIQARLRVEAEYSLQRNLPILADAIKSVCGA
jgi:glycosyltransferase involved in cell wall biosynthesis